MYEKYANHETKEDREARKARVQAINAGPRDASGLTAAERQLLTELRRSGYELAHGYLRDERRAAAWYHLRVVEPGI